MFNDKNWLQVYGTLFNLINILKNILIKNYKMEFDSIVLKRSLAQIILSKK